MRNTYDLDSLPHPGASSAKDVAYSRYMELARSVEPSATDHAAARPIKTILIEPNALLREGLRRILAETVYCPSVAASSLEEMGVVQGIESSTVVLIIDASRDHDATCHQARMLKEGNPSAKVIMLIEEYDLKQVVAAFQAGADAYLKKSISHEVLVKSLDLVMLGEAIFPGAILDLLRERDVQASQAKPAPMPEDTHESSLPAKGLSVRETVILRCLMDGDSNKIIARKFDITEATVKVHVKAILRKIQAKNRTQAAIWAASHLPATQGSANT
ncbi:response regulator transcription factor [Microvirga lotononidis]|uniref:Response regulator containing a CheY-like receiver domain and an HTH DNA-binding domain n=1 Tax=Microvirga lotononidis TaxID=864069 RepID=I4YUU9_9HYPH|nr:response regulator transcription factor [Microvirga lotononidis]EIM27741.1 response regulator containing a CheY-like receiver domain and an HTH DNA-binding domain [Microvirga lotononidis]WQO28123.1 response regulator transcription factor [Microvirga lotononidis]